MLKSRKKSLFALLCDKKCNEKGVKSVAAIYKSCRTTNHRHPERSEGSSRAERYYPFFK